MPQTANSVELAALEAKAIFQYLAATSRRLQAYLPDVCECNLVTARVATAMSPACHRLEARSALLHSYGNLPARWQ